MANFNIDYLVVAGGGGGGGSAWTTGGASGGGGGAGEYLYQTSQNIFTSTSYSVTVGDGGVASGYGTAAGQGSDSVFNAVTVNGGGRGASGNGLPYGTETIGGDGGSGGGGAAAPSSNTPAAGGSSVLQGGGLGSTGGSFSSRGTRWGAGGGGGATSNGINGNLSDGGNGGDGATNAITGTNTTYAGGGGGGTFDGGSTYAGSGGTGGGGSASSTTGGNGISSTGGGGGGGSYASPNHYEGGAGGSGIVILRYATADVAGYTVTGAAPTETTDGTDTVLSFTTVGTSSITFTAPTPPPPTPIFDGTKVTTPVTGFESGVDVGLKIPIGTNSNIPTGVEGMIRNDTEENGGGTNSTTAITFYNGTDWKYFTSTISPDSSPIENFNTVLYDGNGSTKIIDTVGFQPDLVWTKGRNYAGLNGLTDSINGNNTFNIANTTAAMNTNSSAPKNFNSLGFTLGAGNNNWNGSPYEYVAWCFKAGGLINKAADFNGSSSIVKSTNLGAAFNSQTTLSIAGWFKTSTSTSRMTIASFSNTAVGSTDLWIGLYANKNTIAFRNSVEGASGILQVDDTGGSNLRDGNWHHVVFTADSSGTHVYIDGSELTGYTYTFGNSSTNIQMPSINQFSIGANQDSSASGGQWFMNGIINQVRVFTSALSASQVTELYNETAADNNVLNYPAGAGCVAAYPLGENANGLDGLYNGTASNVTFGKPGYLTRNTEGTIESTVSVNNDLGFSIVKYTGNNSATMTVGHGLSQTPQIVISKRLDSAQDWGVYTNVSTGDNTTNWLSLNDTDAYGSGNYMNLSSTLLSAVSTGGFWQQSSQIAYCFTSKPGFSKVGSYVGNGTTGNNKVDTGFEPAFVMIKSPTYGTASWLIIDNKRVESNGNLSELFADTSSAESGSGYDIDFNVDGFTLNTTTNNANRNNEPYIYLAFAT